ncbi:hypothetical protein RCL1_007502 [Eukaryota sp. TZLM3-RCL]
MPDPLDHIFPLCFGVCSGETKENWSWFLTNLSQCFALPETFVFVSDRGCGLVPAVIDCFPEQVHLNCAKHLADNLRKNGANSDFIAFFWRAVYTPSPQEYQEILTELQKFERPFIYLQDRCPAELWAESKIGVNRHGQVTSNLCESMNSVILPDRAQPITALLERIRQKLCQWFVERRIMARNNKGNFLQEVKVNLSKRMEVARTLSLTMVDELEYEVRENKKILRVDLSKGECSGCTMNDGLPCLHICRALRESNEDIETFINSMYLTENYYNIYNGKIYGVDEELERNEEQHVPENQKRVGRPKVSNRHRAFFKKKRARLIRRPRTTLALKIPRIEVEEQPNQEIVQEEAPRRKNKCSICKEIGHTKTRCPRRIQLLHK